MGEPTAKENPWARSAPRRAASTSTSAVSKSTTAPSTAIPSASSLPPHGEDPAPLFSGLPDNACQARHWGVVLEGTLVIRYTDNTEDIIEAGEAYYAPPSHLPLFKGGTRLIEFSPTDELDKTMAKVMVNVDAIEAF